jgi:hypothetical protein
MTPHRFRTTASIPIVGPIGIFMILSKMPLDYTRKNIAKISSRRQAVKPIPPAFIHQ